MKKYRCNQFKALTYFDAVHDFQSFKSTPRKYLEKCLEQIAIKEHEVKAFVTLKIETARQQADESTQRWMEGRQLSLIDGMPIGIKDLIETFAKDDVDLDYANRWNAPLLKKKLKTKTMIVVNSILVCVIIYLIVK